MKQSTTSSRAHAITRPRTPPDRRSGARAATRDGDTERRILDAAHAVFIRRGTAGARMQEIAAEAGVNQALLHYYFRSKDRLSKAAFERAASQFMPAIVQVLGSDAELEAKVVRVVEIELDHLARAPYLPGYIISELTHHPERVRQLVTAGTGHAPEDVRRHVIDRLRKQLDAAARRGTIQPISPESFIVNLVSLCIFPFAARPMITTMLEMDDRAFDRFIARRRHDLVAFFLRAIRP